MSTPSTARRDALVDAVVQAGRELGAAAVFFHAAVAARLGLGPTDVKTLDLLTREGAMTPKDLGRLAGVAPASVTAILDRLEHKQLVERRPHPDDGRRILVRVDPRAFARLGPLYQGIERTMLEMCESYSDRELAVIARAFADAAARQQHEATVVSEAAEAPGQPASGVVDM